MNIGKMIIAISNPRLSNTFSVTRERAFYRRIASLSPLDVRPLSVGLNTKMSLFPR